MNAPAKEGPLIVVEESRVRRDATPLPVVQPSPLGMLQLAAQRGATIEEIAQWRALYERVEADEARKAFNVAFSNFKAEAVAVLRNKKVDAGPLAGKSYAELFSVVNAVTPALSRCGLGASWRLTKDEKDWIEVTCTLKHALGHSESVSMGGPPDTGGAKSPIQARASTVSYLERYTLKAICGVAEQGEDDDGGKGGGKNAIPESQRADFEIAIDALADRHGAEVLWKKIAAACFAAKDREANDALKALLTAKVETFPKEKK